MAAQLPPFKHFEPRTLRKTLSLLDQFGVKAKVLAGGTDLLALMKRRRIEPEYVLDISRIRGLSYIRLHKAAHRPALRIGALTTIRAIENSIDIRQNYALLYEAAHALGSIQIRNIATIGGNICRASPSADMVPPLLALNAKAVTVNQEGEREILLTKFFTGPGINVLRPNELLTEIQVPHISAHTGTAFLKISRTCLDLAKINVAVMITVKDRVCDDIRIALGAVAPTPLRASKAEEALRGKELNEETIDEGADIVDKEVKPITDIRSTADYRKKVSKILVKRAIKIALQRALC